MNFIIYKIVSFINSLVFVNFIEFFDVINIIIINICLNLIQKYLNLKTLEVYYFTSLNSFLLFLIQEYLLFNNFKLITIINFI
jgi:hypothetical protein